MVCGATKCHSSFSDDILKNFQELIIEKGLEATVQVIKTGCFGFCEQGPIVKMMPDNTFYTRVTPEDCLEIVEEHILKGNRVKRLLHKGPDTGVSEGGPAKAGLTKKQIRIALRNCGVINYENIG